MLKIYTAVRQIRPSILRDVYQVVLGNQKVFSREVDTNSLHYLQLQREIARDVSTWIPQGIMPEDIISQCGEIYLESASPTPLKLPEHKRASFFALLFNEMILPKNSNH